MTNREAPRGGITYCCYGMYAEVGHSADCPTLKSAAQPEQAQEAVASDIDSLQLYKTLRDLTDEAGAVDTVIGRPDVLRRRLAALRDAVGQTRGDIPTPPAAPTSETSATASVEGLSAAAPAVEGLNSDTLWQLALDECDAFECDNDGRCIEEGMHFRNRAALLRFAALVIDRTDAERAAALTTHREHPAAQQEILREYRALYENAQASLADGIWTSMQAFGRPDIVMGDANG